jgi:hypothetical protein
MEQIAVLKLHCLPKALAQGVDVFTLDLDAGFVDDPRKLIDIFHKSGKDVLVQVSNDQYNLRPRGLPGVCICDCSKTYRLSCIALLNSGKRGTLFLCQILESWCAKVNRWIC